MSLHAVSEIERKYAYVLNTAYCYSILEAYILLFRVYKAEHFVFTIDMLYLP